MARRDGGAAFPRTGYYPDMSGCGRDGDSIRERLDALTTPESGMSLRAWFAAHAPEVPEWFTHVPWPNKPTPPTPAEELAGPPPEEGAPENYAWTARVNGIYAGQAKERQAYAQANILWKQADRLSCLAQWGWAYADALLATMNGDPPTPEEAMAEME